MATPAFVHGKLSTVQIGGTYFAGLTINYNEDLSDLTDITYTQSGGATWAVMLPGYNKATGTISFVYDINNQPVLSPENMIPGTLMTLILSPDGTKLYSLSAYSGKFSWAGGPRTGPTACSTDWSSTGTVTRPAS